VAESGAHGLERLRRRDADRSVPLQRRGVAELAAVVVAPAVRVAVSGEGARVRRACAELRKAQITRDQRGLGVVVARPVTELPLIVGAPAICRAVALERAGVAPTGGDDPAIGGKCDGAGNGGGWRAFRPGIARVRRLRARLSNARCRHREHRRRWQLRPVGRGAGYIP